MGLYFGILVSVCLLFTHWAITEKCFCHFCECLLNWFLLINMSSFLIFVNIRFFVFELWDFICIKMGGFSVFRIQLSNPYSNSIEIVVNCLFILLKAPFNFFKKSLTLQFKSYGTSCIKRGNFSFRTLTQYWMFLFSWNLGEFDFSMMWSPFWFFMNYWYIYFFWVMGLY